MPIVLKKKTAAGVEMTCEVKGAGRANVWVVKKKKRVGHTKPQVPSLSLAEPGRLRVAHVISLLSISHSAFYAGLKSGKYPLADGRDGRSPYWNTSTIKRFLES